MNSRGNDGSISPTFFVVCFVELRETPFLGDKDLKKKPLYLYFMYLGVIYLRESDVCGVTLSLYMSIYKTMPDHGGN